MLILTVLQGPDKGRRFELPDNEPQMIGRSSESLPLGDSTISRRHCELTPDDGRWILRDLESANGTFVNGQRVADRQILNPGDQIRAGNTLMMYGQEVVQYGDYNMQVAGKNDMNIAVEKTMASNDDSMIMAVKDPGEAAVLQLKVIYDMTQLIGSVIDQAELFECIMDVIFSHFRADRAYILLSTDENPEILQPVVVRHRKKVKKQEEKNITVSRTIVQHVIHHKEGVLSSNAMNDERFSKGDSVREYGIRSAMCVPIKYKDEMFGVINLDSKIANYTFTEDQLRLLTAIGVQTGLALANVRLYSDQLKAERLAAVGQTVASLSHSIKNILQGLRGGAEVVELGMRKNKMDTLQAGWQIVARNLDRIMGLTLNMLTYSKQRMPDIGIENIHQLVEDAISLVERQFDAKNVALISELDPEMPPVPCDAAGMHQALLNLLNNALDAVAPDDGIVTVRAEYDDDAHVARIFVIDNGEGIAEYNTQRLFEPFYSTKGQRGTGLGLVVTKKVVDEHGGKIAVESKRNEDSRLSPAQISDLPQANEADCGRRRNW